MFLKQNDVICVLKSKVKIGACVAKITYCVIIINTLWSGLYYEQLIRFLIECGATTIHYTYRYTLPILQLRGRCISYHGATSWRDAVVSDPQRVPLLDEEGGVGPELRAHLVSHTDLISNIKWKPLIVARDLWPADCCTPLQRWVTSKSAQWECWWPATLNYWNQVTFVIV